MRYTNFAVTMPGSCRYLLAQLIVAVIVFGLAQTSVALEVVVSISPQKWLAQQLLGKEAEVRVLVKDGQDPHTFEPTPRQVASLSKADVWFTLGMEFEQALVDTVREAVPSLQIIDLSENVQKHPMVPEDHPASDDHHEHESSTTHESGHGDGLDPHIWLSPHNLRVMAANMARVCAELDPAGSAHYTENLAQLDHYLHELHRRLDTLLKPHAGSAFYVFHPSFGYFAETYNLVQHAVEIEGKSPGPRQLSKLVARAKADGVKVIFVQPQFDPKSARVVAAAIEGRVAAMDPLAEDVGANLIEMAENIEAALRD